MGTISSPVMEYKPIDHSGAFSAYLQDLQNRVRQRSAAFSAVSGFRLPNPRAFGADPLNREMQRVIHYNRTQANGSVMRYQVIYDTCLPFRNIYLGGMTPVEKIIPKPTATIRWKS